MSRHISEQYDNELSYVREQLMEMGGLVEQQVNNACIALFHHDISLANDVREREQRLNQFEVEIDDLCVSIIAKRQPTASDLRAVVSVMKAITDLERIGDEANRIAKMAIQVAAHDMPDDQYSAFRSLHSNVVPQLHSTLDAFARLDVDIALQVIRTDEEIDAEYKEIVRHTTDLMRADPATIDHGLNIIWSARALERIGDHAKNISEYIIYQVKGEDVRHAKAMQDDLP